MKNLNTDLKYLIFLWIILILAIIPTYGHHGHLLIDSGREAYYPTQILLGKVLYKDIFNVYGPFAYMFNAVLFKFFGINLNVLYLMGCLCSFVIVSFIYSIARKFLPAFLSFSIAVYTISIGILNLQLFNFILPYSYAMVYGLIGFLASVWLLFKYQENPDNNFYLYLSSFFAGLCIANKYEFFPYLIVILYAMIKIKPLRIKEYLYTIFSILFIPALCFLILFLQGLRVSDLVTTASIIKKMSQTKTLKYLYQTSGVYYSKYTIPFLLYLFIKTIIPFSLFIYSFKLQKKIVSIPVMLFGIFLIYKWTGQLSFGFFPALVLILTILNFKRIKENIPLTILTLSCITFSLKTFWTLGTFTYGVFFVSFLLITIIALVDDIFKNNNFNYKAIGIYILIFSTILGYQNVLKKYTVVSSRLILSDDLIEQVNINPFYLNIFLRAKYINDSTILEKRYLITSNRGQIYTNKTLYPATKELIDYINKNTKKTDTVAIFPDGAMINFLTDRPSDNFYLSLIPVCFETFGNETIIKHFQKTKPEYIIFVKWNKYDHPFLDICQDYAQNFCKYVASSYKKEKVIGSDLSFIIYKK